jgi:hypothetical protein
MGQERAWAIAAVVAISGCGSSSKPPALGTEGPEAGSTSSSGAGADGQATGGFAVGGVLNDATGGGSPLAGASVCLIAAPSTCTTTDSAGNFLLDGLAGSGDGFTASLTGYATGVWPITPTGNATGWAVLLRSTTRLDTLAQSVGTTFDSSTGALVFAAMDAAGNGLAGVSVSVGAGGKVAYFMTGGSTLDSTLTATTTSGGGFAFGVPAGTVGLTFTAPGKVCVRNGAEGWTGGTGQTTTVPVVGGRLTRAAAVCQ